MRNVAADCTHYSDFSSPISADFQSRNCSDETLKVEIVCTICSYITQFFSQFNVLRQFLFCKRMLLLVRFKFIILLT